jgi:2,4-dienoyl-CoA reductase-like NADH-dependent reductase (Old Yellow Enzyme family)
MSIAPETLQGLFTPFQCRALTTRNRFVMAPMTRYCSPNGTPTDAVIRYYHRRAQAEVGLIISEGAGIDRPESRAVESVPGFCGDAALREWQRLAAEVHAAGGKMAPQLWHVGGCADYNYPDAPHAPLVSPSGWIGAQVRGGRAMSEEDIADTVSSYARAVHDARRLGFDAVEIHGAHGYLIDQFFWAETNRRKDRYGGDSMTQRARFAVELLKAARREAGEDLPLILRISQWKIAAYDTQVAHSPQELEAWCGPLADAGVDIFHCSQRSFWAAEFPGSDLNFAGWVRKLTGRPTVTVGSVGLMTDLFDNFETGRCSAPNVGRLSDLAARFERGDFDLIAVGRALLADPFWVVKVKHGRFSELRPYNLKPYSTEAMANLY